MYGFSGPIDDYLASQTPAQRAADAATQAQYGGLQIAPAPTDLDTYLMNSTQAYIGETLAQSSGQSATSWLNANAVYVGLGVAGVFLVMAMAKGGR